jgi:hypothetical protein
MAKPKNQEPEKAQEEQEVQEVSKPMATDFSSMLRLQLDNVLAKGKDHYSRYNTLTANQQALRKKTEDDIKQDEMIKSQADEINSHITELLDIEDERVFVLVEELLEEALDTVKEAAKNYLEGHASEEAKANRAEQEKVKAEFDKARTLYTSAKVMCEFNDVDVSDVDEFPTLQKGGRKAGSGTGTRQKNVKTIKFHYTRDGIKQDNYDTLSRALWYSSAKSGGSAKDGRLNTSEFLKLYREKFGTDDTIGKTWELVLPNNTKVGFVREDDTPEPEAEVTSEAPVTE